MDHLKFAKREGQRKKKVLEKVKQSLIERGIKESLSLKGRRSGCGFLGIGDVRGKKL